MREKTKLSRTDSAISNANTMRTFVNNKVWLNLKQGRLKPDLILLKEYEEK